MGLITDEENLQLPRVGPASQWLRWSSEPQLLRKYTLLLLRVSEFILASNGQLAAVCTLRFHSTNICKQHHHQQQHQHQLHSKVALKNP